MLSSQHSARVNERERSNILTASICFVPVIEDELLVRGSARASLGYWNLKHVFEQSVRRWRAFLRLRGLLVLLLDRLLLRGCIA